MRKLVSDLCISLDGYAAGEKTPGPYGMLGPDLEAWVQEHVDEPLGTAVYLNARSTRILRSRS